MKKTLLPFLALIILTLLVACQGKPTTNQNARIQVLVSILPQKQFVEAVGGPAVQVHVLIPAGASPATYEPKSSDLIRVERADVFFRIGHVGFERTHLSKMCALNPEMKVVDTSQKVQLRYFSDTEAHSHDQGEDSHSFEESGVQETEHKGPGEVDPHIWLSPPAVKQMVASIAEALAEIKPEQAGEFQANALAYSAQLDTLHAGLSALLSSLDSRTILVFHPAWGYLADTYGLRQVAIEQSGKDPTIEQLRHVIETAKEFDIKVIFIQQQFSRELAFSVAQEIGGSVVALDPLAEDYLENMRLIGQTLMQNLK